MMTTLLLYGYASSLYSPRRIAKAAVERADFVMIAGATAGLPRDRGVPQASLKGLAGLFAQVVRSSGSRTLLTKGGYIQG